MESERFYESDTPKETPLVPAESPSISRRGQMNMSMPLPPENEPQVEAPPVTPQAQTAETPLPRTDNPETKEISGSPEAVPGRDDGLPQTPQPVSDPVADGRRRIQQTLDATPPAQPTTDLPPATGDILPSVSPPLPAVETTTPSAQHPLAEADSSAAPPLPPTFKTDYSSTDLGGAADQINAENADINKANRELREASAEAARIESETGLPIDEYRRQAAFRLAHPELYDSSDPQEILTASIPNNPPLTEVALPPVPVENAIPAPSDAPEAILEPLPDGRLAAISGNPEIKKQFTHPQGDNSLGYLGTCGIVSCEDVAKQQGITGVSEDGLVNLAAEKNLCVNDASDPYQLGGTTDANRAEILSEIGIPNEMVPASSLEELAGYIENNQSAIATVNAGVLWNDPNYLGNGLSNHAISITGVARDPQSGDILGVFINDSGTGQAGKFITAPRFENAWLKRGGRLNLTLPKK